RRHAPLRRPDGRAFRSRPAKDLRRQRAARVRPAGIAVAARRQCIRQSTYNPSSMNLLLLPGLLCDRAVWAPVLPELGAIAQCDVAEYSAARSLVAMAERILDDAPPTFALAGHSMGGRVALEIVRRAPERVERLALLDTGYRARPGGVAGEQERARRMALLALAQDR